MIQFEYHNPARIIFGCGKVGAVGGLAQTYGHKALVVTSGSSQRTGLLPRVLALLGQAGVEQVVFDKVKANPLTTMVQEGAALAKREQCDLVIGLGGGSAMDAAKAVAFLAINDGDVTEYMFGAKQGTGALPVILITTTAGTGSEGNNIAVLTNPDSNDKKGLKSPFMYAKASIVDPELLMTLPKRSIAGPGLDALFHAMEAYVAKRSNPMSEMIALEAISLSAQYLPQVYAEPENIEAWEKVALANTLGGMAIDAAGTTLPHGLEHPVSGLLNAPHGEGLAALFVPIMKFTYRAVPAKYARIAGAMGESIAGLSVEKAAVKSIEAMETLLRRLNMTPKLGDFGVREENIDWLADNALKIMKANIENNPRVPTRDEIKEIYKNSL